MDFSQEELETLDGFAQEIGLDKKDYENEGEFYKELAEKAEASKDGDKSEDEDKAKEYNQNQMRRTLKALNKDVNKETPKEEVKSEEKENKEEVLEKEELSWDTLSRDDWDLLKSKGITKDSPEFKEILNYLDKGLFTSASEALEDDAVQFKLDKIEEKRQLSSKIEEGDEDFLRKTKAELKADLDKGKYPNTEEDMQLAADSVLDNIV